MKGFFGDMFDFDRDGELNDFEFAADFAAFADLMESDEECGEQEELELCGLELD